MQQLCPFAEKCYRKNPMHFSEMRHPHRKQMFPKSICKFSSILPFLTFSLKHDFPVEKIVGDQLEGTVELPNSLDFEYRDKSILLDQLKIVQMILRKEKALIQLGNGKIPATPSTTSNSPATHCNLLKTHNSPASSPKLTNSPILLSKHVNSPVPPSKLLNAPTPSVKREMDSPNLRETKKPREELRCQTPPQGQQPEKPDSHPFSGTSTTTKTPRALSIFDKYSACTSQSAREEFRRTAMMHMMRANQRIPHTGSKGEFDMKYALSSPYFVFLTAVQNSPETWSQPYSITFPEILDTSMGEIEESLHINFMVDVGWLCLQYLFACQPTKMLVLLGQRCDTEAIPQDIKVVKVELSSKYGTHHSKISVLKYKNGVRVIVSTANLYEDDWQNRTQALWISPHLPRLPEEADKTEGESTTGFKGDFLRYLQNYGANRIQHWLDILERTDFSSIDVFFLASVPGNHKDDNRDRWGLRRLAALLSSHAELPADGGRWPVVAQSSSIGSLGATFQSWLGNHIVPALSSETSKGLRSAPNFQFIYPTVENYQKSFDMSVGSCCLPYGNQLHAKQKWLNNYCQ